MIFEAHAAVESYEASEKFFNCKMEDDSFVNEHVLKMSRHANKLQSLGIVIPNALGIYRVLQSLPPSYNNFVMNYNMQSMNKQLLELFSMLKSAEVEIKKEHQVLMVNKTTKFKKGKSKQKGHFKKGGKKVTAQTKKTKAGPKHDTECFYCKGEGHWKLAQSTWRILRTATSRRKVYPIYMLLMCISLVLVVVPGYLILVRLLIFVTRNRCCRINGS